MQSHAGWRNNATCATMDVYATKFVSIASMCELNFFLLLWHIRVTPCCDSLSALRFSRRHWHIAPVNIADFPYKVFKKKKNSWLSWHKVTGLIDSTVNLRVFLHKREKRGSDLMIDERRKQYCCYLVKMGGLAQVASDAITQIYIKVTQWSRVQTWASSVTDARLSRE